MTVKNYKRAINRQYAWYYKLARINRTSVCSIIRYSSRLDSAIDGINEVAIIDSDLHADDFSIVLDYGRFVRDRFDTKYSV